MLIQEDHEQSKKLTSSWRDGKAPGNSLRAPSAELPPSSVRSLRERVVATVEEHDDGAYMRVRSKLMLTYFSSRAVVQSTCIGVICTVFAMHRLHGSIVLCDTGHMH